MMFAQSQTRIQNTSDSPEGAKTKCRCGLEAALKVSTTGRKYLGCQRRAAAGQCEFTRMLPQQGPSPTQTSSQNEISDPNPMTLDSTMKRTLTTEDSDPQLLPSQKRAKTIEAELKEPQPPPQDSLSASQKRVIAIQEALADTQSLILAPPAFGRHPNPPDIAGTQSLVLPPPAFGRPIADSRGPPVFAKPPAFGDSHGPPVIAHPNSTPDKEVRAEDSEPISSQSSSRANIIGPLNGAPSFRAANTDKSSWLHTPKRTDSDRSASFLASPELSPVQFAKGKQRVNEERYQEKPTIVSAEGTPSKKHYSASSVTHTLEDLFGLPNYLRTLEKGHEIKDMKIMHLENEVQRLKDKQGELEKLLQMYEQHSSHN